MRGGARPGAGRKRGEFTRNMATLLSEVVTPDDWHDVVRALVDRARGGDIRAANLLLRFRYGWSKEGATDPKYLSFIHIIDPHDPDRNQRMFERYQRERAAETGEAAPESPAAEPSAPPPLPEPPAPARRLAHGRGARP